MHVYIIHPIYFKVILQNIDVWQCADSNYGVDLYLNIVLAGQYKSFLKLQQYSKALKTNLKIIWVIQESSPKGMQVMINEILVGHVYIYIYIYIYIYMYIYVYIYLIFNKK